MSFLGAYQKKYKYPAYGREHRVQIDDIFIKPDYKVDGLEPDVADANLLDRDIDDIGRKLGAFQADIDAHIRSGMSSKQMVLNDELIGNRVNVVGADDTASTVEPEVRRIFGEYQTAAFLDGLSDDDSDSDDSYDDDMGIFEGGDEDVDANDTATDGTETDGVIGMEKSYQGITYYEVDNTKQFTFEPNVENAASTIESAIEDAVEPVVEDAAEAAAEAAIIGASDFTWDDVLE